MKGIFSNISVKVASAINNCKSAIASSKLGTTSQPIGSEKLEDSLKGLAARNQAGIIKSRPTITAGDVANDIQFQIMLRQEAPYCGTDKLADEETIKGFITNKILETVNLDKLPDKKTECKEIAKYINSLPNAEGLDKSAKDKYAKNMYILIRNLRIYLREQI